MAERANTTRRDFFKMAPVGLATAAVIHGVGVTAEERIEHHLSELLKAWNEAYDNTPTVIRYDGSDHLHRHIVVAST